MKKEIAVAEYTKNQEPCVGDTLILKGIVSEDSGICTPVRVRLKHYVMNVPKRFIREVNGVSIPSMLWKCGHCEEGDSVVFCAPIFRIENEEHGWCIRSFYNRGSRFRPLYPKCIVSPDDIIKVEKGDSAEKEEKTEAILPEKKERLVSLAEAICKVLSGEWRFAESADKDAMLAKDGRGRVGVIHKGDFRTKFEFYANEKDDTGWRERGKAKPPKYVAVQGKAAWEWRIKI